MANPLKGEATLGDYTLAYNFGAFIELEDKMGFKVPLLLDSLASGLGFRELRDFVWAGLRTHHRDTTDDDVVGLLNDVGYEVASEAVAKAVKSFFGTAEAKDKNPTKSAR